MEKKEVETIKTQKEVETEETPEEVPSEKTPSEATLTKEQKSKLDSFDRLYAENKEMKEKLKEKETPKEEPAPEEPKDEELKEELKITKFLATNPDKNYSEDEVAHIALVAKERKLTLAEAAKEEESYIQFNREKVAKEKQIPEPGKVPPPTPSVDFKLGPVPTDGPIPFDEAAHEKGWREHMKKFHGQDAGV